MGHTDAVFQIGSIRFCKHLLLALLHLLHAILPGRGLRAIYVSDRRSEDCHSGGEHKRLLCQHVAHTGVVLAPLHTVQMRSAPARRTRCAQLRAL